MEAIKAVWEAFKSDMKTRLGIAIGFSVFLLSRKYIETLSGGKELFSVLAVPSFLICIIFWISLIIDLGNIIFRRIQEKRAYRSYIDYILNLSNDKYLIVETLYNAPQHQAEFKYNSTDVRDLMKKGIIELSQTGNIVSRYEINDPTVNFLLTSLALKTIEDNYDDFRKNKNEDKLDRNC